MDKLHMRAFLSEIKTITRASAFVGINCIIHSLLVQALHAEDVEFGYALNDFRQEHNSPELNHYICNLQKDMKCLVNMWVGDIFTFEYINSDMCNRLDDAEEEITC